MGQAVYLESGLVCVPGQARQNQANLLTTWAVIGSVRGVEIKDGEVKTERSRQLMELEHSPRG